MTADGKLAPATRNFVPFTTKRDQSLMMELRAEHDAVMSGARTVDLAEVTLGTGGEKFRAKRKKRGLKEEHIRIIVSGSGSIDPKAYIFTKRFSPIIILTTERAGKKLPTLKKLADDVHVSKGKHLDFKSALAWLREKWKVKTLLCEGGGEVNGGLFDAGLVDQIYLTIAPQILGGRNAPTLADGEGVKKLIDAQKFILKKMQQVGDELYTVYRAAPLPYDSKK